MKTKDFINQAIGNRVYLTALRDLGMRGELKQLIYNKTPLRLIKLTKSGLAYVKDEATNRYYSVPPTNVREFEEVKWEWIIKKYSRIEDKIPSVWKTYEEAGIELAQDLSYGYWDVQDPELYRVISLVSYRVKGLRITQHLDPKFSFMGLYPEMMKPLDGEFTGGLARLLDVTPKLSNKRFEHITFLDHPTLLTEKSSISDEKRKEIQDRLDKYLKDLRAEIDGKRED